MHDLVIRGGTVVDGTGSPGVIADVAVQDGRIAAIGTGLDGERILDAGGAVVAPGFIDIHTHYDAQVFWDPFLTPSCFHGVTTVVAGNCGFSLAPTRPEHRELIARTLENVEDMDVEALAAGVPWDFSTFAEYLDSVERRGLGLNFACYLGHTPLRLFVMGDEAYERAATAEEVVVMQQVLREGLEAGAAGFATSFSSNHRGAGGKPVPSRLADRAELDALLATLGTWGRGVAAFTDGPLLPFQELYDLQPTVGVPFTFSAIVTRPSGVHDEALARNREGWAAGAEVWPQVSPRPLRFAIAMHEPFTLNANPLFGDLIGSSHEDRRTAYRDPAWRSRALDWWAANGPAIRWETYVVAETSVRPELIGRRICDLAVSTGVATPFDALLDLAAEDLTMRVACMVANDDVEGVARLLAEDRVTLGLSDGGAHVSQICDAPQATDYLGKWVRDRGVLPLEEAVHRLSGRQADIFGIPDRGRLLPGNWADVVVFDPATVHPGPTRRVADFPAGSERLTADAPIGIRHVLVNGTPIRVDEVQDLDVRPGRIVRPASREDRPHVR